MLKMYFSILWTLSFLFSGALALTYQLDTSYSGSRFFDGFDFFTDPDPTHGFVTYVSSSEASSLGLTRVTPNNQAWLGVDSHSKLDPTGPGRKSIRITSKKSWTHGLFVADISHMPGGSCGSWPAFWTFGDDWPNNGEIDIIEGVNSQRVNSMALHTSENCQMSPTNQLGTIQNTNCDSTTNDNAGCGVHSTSSWTYGKGFNAIGGGVYAMEWTSQFIKIWFFPRNSIPSNLKSGRPDTSSWGTPQSYFQGNCDIDSHFKSHNVVFDTTFCGDWASNVWSTDATCSKLASTCNEYVAKNPLAFKDDYWAINSVKVYTSTAAETNGTPSEEPQASPDGEISIEPVAEAPSPPVANYGQGNVQVQNNVQVQGVAQDLSPQLSGKAKGSSTSDPPPPIQLNLDALQNLGDQIIDAMGPEIAVLEAASKKERRGWVFGQDELNIPAKATPSVFANNAHSSLDAKDSQEHEETKITQAEPVFAFDDENKFGNFMPGRQKNDDSDDIEDHKMGKNIAKHIGKIISLISENQDMTVSPTRTNFRNEMHAVTNLFSHQIVKEVFVLNGVVQTPAPTPPPRLRPDIESSESQSQSQSTQSESNENYGNKGIPSSWLRDRPIQKREENAADAENLRLPLVGNLGAGLNAGVRIPGVISADLGVAATATLGAGGSNRGLPIVGNVAAGLGANLGIGLGGGSRSGDTGINTDAGLRAAADLGLGGGSGSGSIGDRLLNGGIGAVGGLDASLNGGNTGRDANAGALAGAELGVGDAGFGIRREGLNNPTDTGKTILDGSAALGGAASINGLNGGTSGLNAAAGLRGTASRNGGTNRPSSGNGLNGNAGVGGDANLAIDPNFGIPRGGNTAPNTSTPTSNVNANGAIGDAASLNGGSSGIGAAGGLGGSASLSGGSSGSTSNTAPSRNCLNANALLGAGLGVGLGGTSSNTGSNTGLNANAGLGAAANLGLNGVPPSGSSGSLGGNAALGGTGNLGMNGRPLGATSGSSLGTNADVGAAGSLGIKGIPLGGNTGTNAPSSINNPQPGDPNFGIPRGGGGGGSSSTRSFFGRATGAVDGGIRGPNLAPRPFSSSSVLGQNIAGVGGGVRGPNLILPVPTSSLSIGGNDIAGGGVRGSNNPRQSSSSFGVNGAVGGGVRGPNLIRPAPTSPLPLGGNAIVGAGVRGTNVPRQRTSSFGVNEVIGGGVRGPNNVRPAPTSSLSIGGNVIVGGTVRGTNIPRQSSSSFGANGAVGGGVRGPNLIRPAPTSSLSIGGNIIVGGGVLGSNIPRQSSSSFGVNGAVGGGVRGPNNVRPIPTSSFGSNAAVGGGVRNPNIARPAPSSSVGGNIGGIPPLRAPNLPVTNPMISPLRTLTRGGARVSFNAALGSSRTPTATVTRTRGDARASYNSIQASTRGQNISFANPTVSPSRTGTRGGARASLNAAQSSARATAGRPIRDPIRPLVDPIASPSRTRTIGGEITSLSADLSNTRFTVVPPLRGPNIPLANPTTSISREGILGGRLTNARFPSVGVSGNGILRPAPTNTRANPLPNASNLPSFSVAGCISSSSFGSGTLIPRMQSGSLTPQACFRACNAFTYAATHDTQCFCTNTLFGIPRNAGACDNPCPGDTTQICGGDSSDGGTEYYLTLYRVLGLGRIPIAEGSAAGPGVSSEGTNGSNQPGNSESSRPGASSGGTGGSTPHNNVGSPGGQRPSGSKPGYGQSTGGGEGTGNPQEPEESEEGKGDGSGRPGYPGGRPGNNYEPGSDYNGYYDDGDEGYYGSNDQAGNARPGSSSGRPGNHHRPSSDDSDDEGYYGFEGPDVDSYFPSIPGYEDLPGGRPAFQGHSPGPYGAHDRNGDGEDGETTYYNPHAPGSVGGYNGWHNPRFNDEPNSLEGDREDGGSGYHDTNNLGSEDGYDRFRPPYGDDSGPSGENGDDEGRGHRHINPLMPASQGSDEGYLGGLHNPFFADDSENPDHDGENGESGGYRNGRPIIHPVPGHESGGSYAGDSSWHNPLFENENGSSDDGEGNSGGHLRHGHQGGHDGSNIPSHAHGHTSHPSESEEHSGNDDNHSHHPSDSSSSYPYIGCISCAKQFGRFVDRLTSPDMTPEICFRACDGFAIAGIHGSHCLCSRDVEGDSYQWGGECSKPCPGKSSGACGGEHDREEGDDDNDRKHWLVSIYGNRNGPSSNNEYDHYNYGSSSEGSDHDHSVNENEDDSQHSGNQEHNGGHGGRDDVHCTEPGCGNGSENSEHENHSERPAHEEMECHEEHCRGERNQHGDKPDHPEHTGGDKECHDESCRGGKNHHGEKPDHSEHPKHPGNPGEDTEYHDGHCTGREKHGDEKPGKEPSHHEGEHCEDGKCKGRKENGEKNGSDEHERGGEKAHEEHEYYTTVLTTTYIDLCTCAEKSLETFTQTTTIEICDCEYPKNSPVTHLDKHVTKVAPKAPECPMETVTKSCNACGPEKENTIIVTVPVKPGPNFPKETGKVAPSPEKKLVHKGEHEGAEVCEDGSCKKGKSGSRKPGQVCEGEECKEKHQGSPKPGHKCEGDDCKKPESPPKPGHKCEEDSCKETPGSPKPYPICEGETCKHKSANTLKPHICEGENCKSKNSTITNTTPTMPGGNPGSCGNSGCSTSNPPGNPGAPDNQKPPPTPPNASSTNATVASLSTKLHTAGQTFGFAVFVVALLCWY